MLYFTDLDYKKIQLWLSLHSVKDSEFDIPQSLKLKDTVTVVLDGKNYKVTLRLLLNTIGGEGQGGGGTTDGLSVYTTDMIEEREGWLPDEYLDIGTPSLKGSTEETTIKLSNNGDYLSIMFRALRSLQNEVAMLRNSFKYGIDSYTGLDTALSTISLEYLEIEDEPLWAIEQDGLSFIDEVTLNHSIELIKESNTIIDTTKEGTVDIKGTAYWEDGILENDLSDIEDTKLITYIRTTSTDIKVHLASETKNIIIDFLKLNIPIVSDYNIMILISRQVNNLGYNYVWISIKNPITDTVLLQGYYNENSLTSSPKYLDSSYTFKQIYLTNLKLYELSFYSRYQDFTNLVIPSTPIETDLYKYKVAHLTVRAVDDDAMLTKVAPLLLERELIYNEKNNSLYIKTKSGIKLISGGSLAPENDMTKEEIILILIENGIIVTEGGLLSLNSVADITFIHEGTNSSYKVNVDSNGNLKSTRVENIDIDEGWKGESTDARFAYRGAVSYYKNNLGSNNYNTTIESDLVRVTRDSMIAKGDRVRISSWYIPNKGQVNFNCTHDFIELTNCGTDDYPLDNAILGIIVPTKDSPTTSTDYAIEEFKLSGVIKAGSSYLIRGALRLSVDAPLATIKITQFDIELCKTLTLYSLQGCAGLLLYHKNLSTDPTFISLKSAVNMQLIKSTSGDFAYQVDSRLIDAVTFNKSHDKLKTSSGAASVPLYTNNSYNNPNNAIVKDLYLLDPAKLGFRSLTGLAKECSNNRIDKVATEAIELNNTYIEFPHSNITKEVTAYSPKASYENKNVLTDKTKPDFNKPNMVTVSFGTDIATTRCFNWFSMGLFDEYVWIRLKGSTTWKRFESYKIGDGTDNTISYTDMTRKEFKESIINSVYKRIDNVFPGDPTYKYRAHKCIIYITNPIEEGSPLQYEYVVGRANKIGDPDLEHTSEIQSFTIYPKDWTPKVYLITDLQGFGWMEYLVWTAAAEELNRKIVEECNNSSKLFPVLINTGDMTQNGTRVNEWLDYYNGGKCLFNHIEQASCIGNNDLCNSYNEVLLGNGNDDGKSSPYYFHVFYCYEISNTTKTGEWSHEVIYKNKYIPSMYYFKFDASNKKYKWVIVNSELTPITCSIYYDANVENNVMNLYTGYIVGEAKLTSLKLDSLGSTLSSWLNDPTYTTIVACHEMPYTVTTLDNLTIATLNKDRSISGTSSLVGSHLNRISANSTYDNDYNYWFSILLQNKGVKLCIGGHKHTYAVTYPIHEVTEGDPTVHASKKSLIKRTAPSYNDGETSNNLWAYDNNTNLSCVIYFMLLATGYKLASNKELPTRSLAYSMIVPESKWKKNESTGKYTGTADVSQTYPMYATFEYNSNKIYCDLFRVVNIKKEDFDTKELGKMTVTEFSETSYSTSPLYSERLVVDTAPTGETNFYKNYWYVKDEYIPYCVGVNQGNLKDIQRCTYDGEYKSVNGNLNNPLHNNHTLEISL